MPTATILHDGNQHRATVFTTRIVTRKRTATPDPAPNRGGNLPSRHTRVYEAWLDNGKAVVIAPSEFATAKVIDFHN